jgi:hypothetical protein
MKVPVALVLVAVTVGTSSASDDPPGVAAQVGIGLLGGFLGAGAGGGIGAGIAGSFCTNPPSSGELLHFDCSFGGGVIGASLGAVIGAGAGIAFVGNTGPGDGSYLAAIGGTAGGVALGLGATGLVALAVGLNEHPGWIALSANVFVLGGGLAGGVMGYRWSHTDAVQIVPTATPHGGGLSIAGQF